MNGEEQVLSSGGGKCATLLSASCPCFVDPCGSKRRGEYVKSLRSFSVLVGLLQVVMFFVSLAVGRGFAPPAQNPMFGPPSSSLVTLGAKQCYLMQKRWQVFRFLTPILLHAGIIHLVMNMLCQWRFALFVERRWGTLRFSLVYIASGFGATLLSCLWSPNRIAVGASGSLMGIMGGFLADLLLHWHTMQTTQRNLLLAQTLAWSTIGLILGFAPLVDGGAHFGGFLVGLTTAFLVNSHVPQEPRNKLLSIIIPSILLGIFAITGTVCFWTVIKCTVYP